MLREFAGFDVTVVIAGLFSFGLSGFVGNIASGRIQPNRLTERLMAALGLFSIVFALFTFFLPFSLLAFVVTFLFELGTFGLVPILNTKIIISTHEEPSLSGTIAPYVFNLANAIDATLVTVFCTNTNSYV